MVLKELFHSPKEAGVNFHRITSIDERFGLDTSCNGVIDYTTGVRYKGDRTVTPISHQSFTNITDLTDTAEMSYPYLYALAVNPIKLPSVILRGTDGPKVYYRSSALTTGRLSDDKVVWVYPEGGVESTRADFKYIPFCSNYAVNASGAVYNLKDSAFISSGHNQDHNYQLTMDNGKLITLHIGDILVLAFGMYNENNYLLPAVPLNDLTSDPSFATLANWVKEFTVDDTSFYEASVVDPRLKV